MGIKNRHEVNGLVDSMGAAEILGVPAATFKVWATRSRKGAGGIPAMMPQPVGNLSGQIYSLEDIYKFRKELAMTPRTERSHQRKTGAYYTPNLAAEVMANWILDAKPRRVLEPSAGDGAFLESINCQSELRGVDVPDFIACELDKEAAGKLAVKFCLTGASQLIVGDYLSQKNLPPYDAAIGNPPYVRIRELPAQYEHSAHAAARDSMGESLSPTASTWVPFLSKTVNGLSEGGRMAFVLPSDFTYVKYARRLWRYLGNNFRRIIVARSMQRLFPNIMQNVIILFLDDKGSSTDSVEIHSFDAAEGLKNIHFDSGSILPIEKIENGEKVFQHELLPADSKDVLYALQGYAAKSKDFLKFNIGYVSGNKKFFHPSDPDIKSFDLPLSSLHPTILTSRELSGGLFTSDIADPSKLWLPGENLTPAETFYVAMGESKGIDMGYKCRIRKPWYKVPGVKIPDIMLSTFSDVPRLVLNNSNYYASNSILAGYLANGVSAEKFVKSWYSPLTALSFELNVHSLGGGVMIAVPSEADSVEIINPKYIGNNDLSAVSDALRSGNSLAAYDMGKDSLEQIVGHQGIDAIWEGYERLSQWRKAA